MTAPHFSIITVTRNNLEGLGCTRESLRSQTHTDFEWIVVDGASTDETLKALGAWQREIKAMVSAPDGGPYDAMNRGLAFARGEYVLFLNAGDALADGEVLARLAAAAQKTPADFYYGDSLEAMKEGPVFYKRARCHGWIFWGMFTHHQAMLFRREFLAQWPEPYDTAYAVGADLDLVWRCLKKTRRVRRLGFAVCRFAPAGISAQRAQVGRQEQMLMRQRYMFCPALVNVGLMLLQKLAWWLRGRAPQFYRQWRRGPEKRKNSLK